MKITDISRIMRHTSMLTFLKKYVKFSKSEEMKIEEKYDPYGHN